MKNWCCRFLSFVAMLGAAMLPLVSASAAVHVVPADGTFDLVDTDSAGLNEAGTVIDLGAGATLRMTNGGGALSLIRSSIVATNGVAYLDLSALTGGDFKIIGSVLCGTTGGLVVKGRDAVFFGQSVSAMHVNYPLFDAPNFTFETAGGAGLVFVNSATLRHLPPSYTITPGARLALRGQNTLADNACWDASAGAHGTLTLTDFDVMLLEETALPDGATVHVGPGRTFFAKPCGVSPTNVFEWVGCTGTNHLDLVLDADASFSPISMHAYALEGTVSGSGRIARPLQSRNAFGEDGMVIRGSLADFHGAIELSACREDDVPFRMRFLDSGDEVKISTVRFLTSGCRLSFESGGTIVNATPEARPLAVSTVYGRDNGGLLNAAGDYCLVGTYATTELDRRPWVSRGARGSGPERNWLDFTDIYAGDTLRNALRVQKVGVAGDQLVTYRSGFYVLDSSNGGGSLLLSDIQGNGGILHRNGFNALSPIWSEGNLGKGLYLNNGTICLDGVSVAGTERGFSGRPEVMSFAASQNMENLNIYMGYINATPNCEVIGETMFYNRVLSDAERQTVEAYLMNKWLGVVPGGYSDLTGTTLTGAGSVTCPMPAALPKLGDGFTGSVAFTDTSYAFTIDATATPAVASSVSIPTGSASIPNGSTIRVDFPTKARAGRYALITAQTFVGASDLWLESSGEIGDATLHLVATATGLALDVLPSGTVIILH